MSGLICLMSDENAANSGFDEKDVARVIAQTNAPRERVIETLAKHKGDLVATIMSLTV